MATRIDKYRQAAVAYFLYGCLYLGGAVYAASTGLSERASLTGGDVGWFVLGGLVVFRVDGDDDGRLFFLHERCWK